MISRRSLVCTVAAALASAYGNAQATAPGIELLPVEYVSHAPQLNPLPTWPRWRRDRTTGAWFYKAHTSEGLDFSGNARVERDTVQLELRIANNTGQDLAWVTANPCLLLGPGRTFGTEGSLQDLFVVMNRSWHPLTATTPTPQQKDRGPWAIMRIRDSAQTWQGPADSPTWWLLDQIADTNIMAAVSRDSRHRMVYTWDTPPTVLMCNAGNPCFHTGPGPCVPLQHGNTVVHRGRIILSPDDPEQLLRRSRGNEDALNHVPASPSQTPPAPHFSLPTYHQTVHLTFANAQAAADADIEFAPLYDGHARAISCRWDDNQPQNLAMLTRLNARGMRATWYLNSRNVSYHGGGDYVETARGLLEGGHAVGGHGLTHPYLTYVHRNRMFTETAAARIEWEAALDTPVSSYAFSFCDYRNDLEGDGVQGDILRVIERAGYLHVASFIEFFERLPSSLIPTIILPPENATFEQFAQACQWALNTEEVRTRYPCIAHSMHSWYDTPALNYGFDELERRLDHLNAVAGDIWHCNSNEFAAYRCQVLHTDMSITREGADVTVSLVRPRTRFLNDDIPLTLAIAGEAAAKLRHWHSPSAPVTRSHRSSAERVLLHLGHDPTEALPQRIAHCPNPTNAVDLATPDADADFPAIAARLHHTQDSLNLLIANRATTRLRDVTATFRLPLAHRTGVVVKRLDVLEPGQRHVLALTSPADADNPLYHVGNSFAAAQIDFLQGQTAGRIHATCRVPGTTPPSFPKGRFRRLGPLPPDEISPASFRNLVAGAAPARTWQDGSGKHHTWRADTSDGRVPQEHLSPEVIRTQGDWFKLHSQLYLLWTVVHAPSARKVRLHCQSDDLRGAALNGRVLTTQDMVLRQGPNHLVLAVHCRRPGTAGHTAFFLRLVDPETGTRLQDIQYRRPDPKHARATVSQPVHAAAAPPSTPVPGGNPPMPADHEDDRNSPNAAPLPRIDGGIPPLRRSRDRVRVAVAQMQTDAERVRAGHSETDMLIPYVERAATEQVDLLVLPEYVLGSFKIDGDKVQTLCEQARTHGLNLMVGGWEYLPGVPIHHPPRQDTFANTILVIDRNGNIAGTHRKMHAAVGAESPHFWPAAHEEIGEGRMRLGARPTVVELDFGRIGVLTCYDGYFFASFEAPALRGAEILVWPNGRAGAIEDWILRTASFMTCTHVVSCNMAVGAGSTICAHPGTFLERTEKPGEAFIVADLDMQAVRQARRNHRMFHQRRPGIYYDLVQQWRPWEAYPDIPPFLYPDETPGTSAAEREEALLRDGAAAAMDPAPQPTAPPERDDAMLRVALLQIAPEGHDQDANLKTAMDHCRRAAAQGADIALLPEMFQLGYTGYQGTGEGETKRWQQQAIGPDSRYLRQLRNLAAELNMAIAATYLQEWHGNPPRNAVSLIDRHGNILFTYAKVHTCDFANFEAACTPGNTFHVAPLDTAIGTVNVGAMVCYDREFPESARILMIKGAEIVLTPNACRLDDLRIHQFQTRAYENATAMFMTNYPGNPHGGRSVAFGPDGAQLAEASAEPGIWIVPIDLNAVREYRCKTIWGNAFRRPHRYGPLTDATVSSEFRRQNAFGQPFLRLQR